MDMLTSLSEHPFLAGLPVPWLAQLATCARRTTHHAGSSLFREGDRADRFWLIRRGRVSLEVPVEGRGDVVVEQLGAGTVVGWSWMFPPYRWHFDGVAAELTHCVELDGSAVNRLCEEDPALGYELTRRFAAVLVNRLQSARMSLIDVYGYPVKATPETTSR